MTLNELNCFLLATFTGQKIKSVGVYKTNNCGAR